MRFFKLAIYRLMTKDQIEDLRKKSQAIYIDPDVKEEEFYSVV